MGITGARQFCASKRSILVFLWIAKHGHGASIQKGGAYGQVLVRGPGEEFAEWARRFAVATHTSTTLKSDLAAAAQDPSFSQALGAAISAIVQDETALHELHEAQCWRLTHWRAARVLTMKEFRSKKQQQ